MCGHAQTHRENVTSNYCTNKRKRERIFTTIYIRYLSSSSAIISFVYYYVYFSTLCDFTILPEHTIFFWFFFSLFLFYSFTDHYSVVGAIAIVTDRLRGLNNRLQTVITILAIQMRLHNPILL